MILAFGARSTWTCQTMLQVHGHGLHTQRRVRHHPEETLATTVGRCYFAHTLWPSVSSNAEALP